MKVSYQREMRYSYMVMESEDQDYNGYEVQMLGHNRIEGLLSFHVKHWEGRQLFCYEITSMQPLDRILEKRCMLIKEMRLFIIQIGAVLGRIKPYLLREQHILLEPSYIYLNPETFCPSLCMVPGYEGDFAGSFSRLLQYLLEKTDHQDKECVVLAYRLYHESLKVNYSLDDILRIVTEREGAMEEHSLSQMGEEHEAMGHQAMEQPPKEPPQKEPTRGDLTLRKPEKNHQLAGVETVQGQGIRLSVLTGSIAAVAAPPVLLWLMRGTYGFARYGLWLAVGEALLILTLALILIRPKQNREGRKEYDYREKKTDRRKHQNEQEEHQWHIQFEELDKPSEPEKQPEERTPIGLGEQTTLLFDHEAEGLCRLQPIEHQGEEILISYVPFTVGKQKQMADFAVTHATVSRLHMRIDLREDSFWVTDLNSTNGTAINEIQLQANESKRVEQGDLIQIADLTYRFLRIEKDHSGQINSML